MAITSEVQPVERDYTTGATTFDPALTYFADGTRVVMRAGSGWERTGVTFGVYGGGRNTYAFQAVRWDDGTKDGVVPHALGRVEEAVVPEVAVSSSDTETYATREQWLVAAVEALAPMFAGLGEELPIVRVSVGFPGGRGRKNNIIGQCWASVAASDGVSQLFVSPVLDEAVRVLDVLLHELVHAVDDCQSGHSGRFAKIAKGLGLTGKMTATVAGEELKAKLVAIVEKLGTYPHAALVSPGSGADGPKKQGTRMIKCECPDCGYTARTTRKWLEEVGPPLCPCNAEPMQAG